MHLAFVLSFIPASIHRAIDMVSFCHSQSVSIRRFSADRRRYYDSKADFLRECVCVFHLIQHLIGNYYMNILNVNATVWRLVWLCVLFFARLILFQLNVHLCVNRSVERSKNEIKHDLNTHTHTPSVMQLNNGKRINFNCRIWKYFRFLLSIFLSRALSIFFSFLRIFSFRYVFYFLAFVRRHFCPDSVCARWKCMPENVWPHFRVEIP